MATRDRTTTGEETRVGGGYGMSRPAPDAARLEPASPVSGSRAAITAPAVVNVLAGIWLIISPWILGYSGSDAKWNPVVFGIAVGVLALGRLTAARGTEWLSWLNMAIGVWLFISAFWLAHSSQASWNVGVLGVVVFVLAVLSLAAEGMSPTARRSRAIG